MQGRVEQLQKQIEEATFKYYRGEPLLMTDAQFDCALEELRSLCPTHQILHTTGWGYVGDRSKQPHLGRVGVGSLKKIKFPATPPEASAPWMLTPKLDGLSVVVYCYNGVLSCLTRDNGKQGSIVTLKMRDILSEEIIETLLEHSKDGMLAIRGEVIVPSSHHLEVCKLHSIPHEPAALRNFAAGVMNRKEVTVDLRYLEFVPYFIRLDSNRSYTNQNEMLEQLEQWGFSPLIRKIMPDYNNDVVEQMFEAWGNMYPIDGLVANPLLSMEGVRTDFTEFEATHARAVKFESETKKAVVGKVVWETGSAGRITPVVVLTSPIELDGANIQNFSGHNATHISEQRIGSGSVVEVTRANNVIPYIVRVISVSEDVQLPLNCSVCGGGCSFQGKHLVCENGDCPSKSRTVIRRLFELSGVPKGIRNESDGRTINDYLSNWCSRLDEPVFEIDNIFDYLYMLLPLKSIGKARRELLVHKFNESAGGLLWELERAVMTKLQNGFSVGEFWYLLNLPSVGKATADKLASLHPKTLKDTDATVETIKRLKLPVNVVSSINNNLELITKIYSHLPLVLEATEEEPASVRFSVVITGKTSMPRAKLVETLSGYGVGVLSSVNKDVKYLVCNSDESTSSKFKKAEKMGINIINEEELMRVAKENHDQ